MGRGGHDDHGDGERESLSESVGWSLRRDILCVLLGGECACGGCAQGVGGDEGDGWDLSDHGESGGGWGGDDVDVRAACESRPFRRSFRIGRLFGGKGRARIYQKRRLSRVCLFRRRRGNSQMLLLL